MTLKSHHRGWNRNRLFWTHWHRDNYYTASESRGHARAKPEMWRTNLKPKTHEGADELSVPVEYIIGGSEERYTLGSVHNNYSHRTITGKRRGCSRRIFVAQSWNTFVRIVGFLFCFKAIFGNGQSVSVKMIHSTEDKSKRVILNALTQDNYCTVSELRGYTHVRRRRWRTVFFLSFCVPP